MLQRVYAYRDAFGIGDWIMSMSALKMMQRSYPDFVIDINLKG